MNGIADPPLPFNGGRFPASDEELALVKRRVLLLYIIFPALSFAAILGGFELAWPVFTAAGVIGLGATGMVIGGLAVREWRLMFIVRSFRGDTRRYVIYEGGASVAFGFAYLIAGLCLVVLAAVHIHGASLQELRDAVLARPSYGLIPVGAFLAAHGLGFLIGFVRPGETTGQRAFNTLLSLPARLAGLILLVWGGAMLAVGLVEWLSPAVFQEGFKSMVGNPWPFSGRQRQSI